MIKDGLTLSYLRKTVSRYFKSAELADGGPFNDQYINFLIFDQSYVTDTNSFVELLSRSQSGLYLGFLLESSSNNVTISHEGSFYIEKDIDAEALLAAFNSQPADVKDGPIAASVNSGFVIPASTGWALWFSTYWEVAISCFDNKKEAMEFMGDNSNIGFMSNDMITEYYRANPYSNAPDLLARYMNHNVSDEH